MTDVESAKRHFYEAVALLDAGDFSGGAQRLREALTFAPDNISILTNLAGALMMQGSFAEARDAAEQVLAQDNRNRDGLAIVAECLAKEGRHGEATSALDALIALEPQAAEHHTNRAAALSRIGRHAEALASADRAIAFSPSSAAPHLNRANALADLTRDEEALASYSRAVSLEPRLAEAWLGRGILLARAGRADEALAAYDKALATVPTLTPALLGRANLLAAMQRHDEALAAFDLALTAAPDLAEAWYLRGTILASRKRFEEAIAAYDRALTFDETVPYARGSRLAAEMYLCDWRQYETERARMLDGVRRGDRVIVPFDMIHVATSAADQLACGRIYAADRCPAAPVTTVAPRTGGERIHVAYLSGDFRYHPVSLLLAGLFEQHDRTRFRTTGISFGRDDGGAMRRRIREGFDSFTDAEGLSDAALAALLADRQIDIAVDLMGFTSRARPGVFAQRPAPLQVNYLGFPGTMGAPWIDYIIADSYVVPAELEQDYAERIIRLPDTFQANDARRPFPERIPTRREYGLPDDAFIFCAFNSLDKITPEIFSAWMRILREMPNSVLWLLNEGPVTEANLRREANARSVAPARLAFAARTAYAEYLVRYRVADLFLDTFPFNGGTTVSDALWMGLPAVTLSGETFASRMAGSLLRAASLPAEFATQSLANYERVALAVANDRSRLAAIRARLFADRLKLPLFDTARFCRHLEAAYVTMYRRHLRGEPPASFTVQPIDP